MICHAYSDLNLVVWVRACPDHIFIRFQSGSIYGEIITESTYNLIQGGVLLIRIHLCLNYVREEMDYNDINESYS